MKDKIPTIKLTVGNDEYKYEAELYKWLTQEEEDSFQEKLGINDMEQDVSSLNSSSDFVLKVTIRKLNEANEHRLKCLLKNPTYEEYNTWNPEARDELLREVTKLIDKKKS